MKNITSSGRNFFDQQTAILEKAIADLEQEWAAGAEFLEKQRQGLAELQSLRRGFSLPVCCIGPVKSGKSSLVNCLAGADLLPTGAGITTSFPTTVTAAGNFSAHFTLRPENEIEAAFQQATGLLLSGEQEESGRSLFDSKHRRNIEQQLLQYRQQQPLTSRGLFNQAYQELRNLLEGAARVSDYYQRQQVELAFDDSHDPGYRHFISDESLSVYLCEIQIKAPLHQLPPHLSLRDLPGLDTPNSSHQSLIIQKLSSSPALVYVISSRIGLRQADYQLLEYLRELEVTTRLSFVLNLDLDEHPDLGSLKKISRRCRQELEELGFERPIYAFSVLASYFSQPRTLAGLNDSNRRRLENWQADQDKFSYSLRGAEKFSAALEKLSREQASLTIADHCERHLLRIGNNLISVIKQHQLQLATETGDEKQSSAQLAELESVSHEIHRLCVSLGQAIEQYTFIQISRFLDDRGPGSLYSQLSPLIEAYQAPEQLIPEGNRNPLLPVKLIENHFKLTLPPRLNEKVLIALSVFLQGLQAEINQRLQQGSSPLFAICQKFDTFNPGEETTFPRIPEISELKLPEFTLSSAAEERFAGFSRLGKSLRLLTRKLRRRKQSSSEFVTSELKIELRENLPRYLRNYREQVKYQLLRKYLEGCCQVLENYFQETSTGLKMVLRQAEEKSYEDQAARAARRLRLEEIRLNVGKTINGELSTLPDGEQSTHQPG